MLIFSGSYQNYQDEVVRGGGCVGGDNEPVADWKGVHASTLYTRKFLTVSLQGPYTETIDLCFEPFFVKEIRHVIE